MTIGYNFHILQTQASCSQKNIAKKRGVKRKNLIDGVLYKVSMFITPSDSGIVIELMRIRPKNDFPD